MHTIGATRTLSAATKAQLEVRPVTEISMPETVLTRARATPGVLAAAGTDLDREGTRALLNPGSVGQPRDGDPRAAWLELDTETWAAHYHRVRYDIEAALQYVIEKMLLDRSEATGQTKVSLFSGFKEKPD